MISVCTGGATKFWHRTFANCMALSFLSFMLGFWEDPPPAPGTSGKVFTKSIAATNVLWISERAADQRRSSFPFKQTRLSNTNCSHSPALEWHDTPFWWLLWSNIIIFNSQILESWRFEMENRSYSGPNVNAMCCASKKCIVHCHHTASPPSKQKRLKKLLNSWTEQTKTSCQTNTYIASRTHIKEVTTGQRKPKWNRARQYAIAIQNRRLFISGTVEQEQSAVDDSHDEKWGHVFKMWRLQDSSLSETVKLRLRIRSETKRYSNIFDY